MFLGVRKLIMVRNKFRSAAVFAMVALVLLAPACRRKKYENPVNKDTQQPDKVLFDTAIDEIEKGRYERARLTLQTLMNTYDTSEFLAKAKLALADSWLREGGAHGFAQAEAEFKDFILFYPNMEESSEAQYKICDMQYKQMDKADRDPLHARLAEQECKDVLLKFPNSKFAPMAAQKLRDVDEVLAEAENRVAAFYFHKGGNGFYSSANRWQALVDQFPLYSHADDSLWNLAGSYVQMGDKYENKQADAYTRLVRDYPLSAHTEDAKAQLQAMNRPIPEPDPVAFARMKYELGNRTKRSLLGKVWGPFSSRPDTSTAAKSGTPQMEPFKPSIPLDVPATATGGATTQEVNITQVAGSDVLDKSSGAAQNLPGGTAGQSGVVAAAPGAGAPAAAGAAPAAGAAASSTPAKKSNKKLKQTPPKPPKIPAVKKPSKKGTVKSDGPPVPQPPDKK